MAALHVLEGDGIRFRVVAHAAVPAGNNTAGNSWKSCLIASGMNTTILPEGAGVGQITTAEKNQIIAGDVIEMVFSVDIPTVGTNGNKLAIVQAAVAKMRADYLAALASKFSFYGYTNG